MQVAHPSVLTAHDLEKLKRKAVMRQYERDSQIFAEGDAADELYVIESGRVAVVIQEFSHRENVNSLGPGDYFGEMAFFLGDRRAATVMALEKTALHCLDRNSFLELYESDVDLAAKFDALVATRNRELARKETLIDHPGGKGGKRHIGIKGDPSLRESAFTRERYESVADQCLPLLQAQLYELLLNRSAYEVSIHFNSGEVHLRTVFDPFAEEVHPANKLADRGYVQRHFPPISYEHKCEMIKRFYGFMSQDPGFECLPAQSREMLHAGLASWQPVDAVSIVRILSRLPLLRKIQNFYIRNFTLSTLRDVVRMQFNCDGAHIVDIEQFEAFLEENIPLDELAAADPANDRRRGERRNEPPDGGFAFDRRTPLGRRKEDWEAHIRALSERSRA